ncbi:permease prefix domain 1-containing protein [Streptosporangium sp. NPDC051023]|uniref:permease prefix domain 1-containing protein n=1 Tax=Streptosporangium sp. NPDC051023 TaxID=3155410 RepID=UPI00344BD8F6
MAEAGVIDDYVTGLSRTLKGPRRPKLDLVTEARDSLLDAAEALEHDGLGRAEAELAAVEEFGSLEEIAPGYQEALSISAGRRLAAVVFVSVPLTTLAWSVVWRFYPEAPAAYAQWPGWYRPVSCGLDVLQLFVGLLGGAALFALGRGLRRIRRPRLVTRALAVLVWTMLPITIGLGLMLMYGYHHPAGLSAYPLSLGAEALSFVFTFTQLYCATRCLTGTRRRPVPAQA